MYFDTISWIASKIKGQVFSVTYFSPLLFTFQIALFRLFLVTIEALTYWNYESVQLLVTFIKNKYWKEETVRYKLKKY